VAHFYGEEMGKEGVKGGEGPSTFLFGSTPMLLHLAVSLGALASCLIYAWALPAHPTICNYSASALLAIQGAVLARPFLPACPSVTFRYCVETNEDTIVWFPLSGRTILKN